MFWNRKSFEYSLHDEIPLSTPIDELSFTVFDTETTGFQLSSGDRLIEIGAVHMSGKEVTSHTYHTYVNPERSIPPNIKELTGISNDKTDRAPLAYQALSQFFSFTEQHNTTCLVGHYVMFDLFVLKEELKKANYTIKKPKTIDTLDLIGYLSPSYDMRDLHKYAMAFGTRMYDRHTALGDASTTAYLFAELLRQAEDRGVKTWGDLLNATDSPAQKMSF
jgi:DNA polymerase III subunit epsilon